MNEFFIRWAPTGADPIRVEWGNSRFSMPVSDWFDALDRGDVTLKHTRTGLNSATFTPEVRGEWLGRWISEHPEKRIT